MVVDRVVEEEIEIVSLTHPLRLIFSSISLTGVMSLWDISRPKLNGMLRFVFVFLFLFLLNLGCTKKTQQIIVLCIICMSSILFYIIYLYRRYFYSFPYCIRVVVLLPSQLSLLRFLFLFFYFCCFCGGWDCGGWCLFVVASVLLLVCYFVVVAVLLLVSLSLVVVCCSCCCCSLVTTTLPITVAVRYHPVTLYLLLPPMDRLLLLLLLSTAFPLPRRRLPTLSLSPCQHCHCSWWCICPSSTYYSSSNFVVDDDDCCRGWIG